MNKKKLSLPWYLYWIYEMREREWEQYKKRKLSRLSNRNFSIIASSCNGTIMYYDLGLQYLSPTINLCIDEEDFIKMVENLKWYMDGQLVELVGEEGYPLGQLNDIKIRFIHYRTFSDAALKWEERKKRINWDNLFIVGVSCDGDLDIIRRFERLPYKNKVIFSPIEYPGFESVYCIKFKERWGTMTEFKRQVLKRRYLDEFDYVTFLNGVEQEDI